MIAKEFEDYLLEHEETFYLLSRLVRREYVI